MKRFKFITTSKMGKNFGDSASKEGFFFTDVPDYAKHYSGVLRSDTSELGVTEYIWSGEWVRAEDHDAEVERLRKERDELIISMKDIVAIWEAGEGTAEEDGERMASLAYEMSDKWEI